MGVVDNRMTREERPARHTGQPVNNGRRQQESQAGQTDKGTGAFRI